MRLWRDRTAAGGERYMAAEMAERERNKLRAKGLRREREQGEKLVRCGNCGRVEIPLNEREAWNWAVGKGPSITEGDDCPNHKRGWHDWKPAP